MSGQAAPPDVPAPGAPAPGAFAPEPFEGYAGFFGKMPAAGDFVSRGLAPELRLRWDAWVTRHLARWEGPWPAGGLGLLLPSGRRGLVAVVLPSADRVGRRFPLAALAVRPEPPSLEAAGPWCAAARGPLAAAVAGRLDPDGLAEALAPLRLAEGGGPGACAAAWALEGGAVGGGAVGGGAVALDPADPAPALAALSSRGSSSP